MILETKVRIPFLWGKSTFIKTNWAQVNLIVGPNGSGKTLLAEELAVQFSNAGNRIFFVKSDRTDQEKMLSVLKNNEFVRGKIETVLSGMFGKSIKFEENPDGTFIPIVINKNRNIEYNLEEGECHGLKEILTLLVALYSTSSGCLFFDEPELHLHPQFQLFFMNEIRRAAAENPERIFFLITHSPFFIDLRFPEDLTGVVVCHSNRIPTHIEQLSQDDEQLFRRFLPRFNTYHKQFFFSDNQIFVEGYTDQQIFSRLLDMLENRYDSIGTGIIDVGGKDELGVFCKVCSLLGTDGRIIADLDSLFRGKLRDVVCADSRASVWLEKQAEKQKPFYRQLFSEKDIRQGITLEMLVSRLESFLIEIGTAIGNSSAPVTAKVTLLREKICALFDKYEKVEDIDTFKTVVLQGIMLLGSELSPALTAEQAALLSSVKNLAALIFAAAEAVRVYILPRGCIEHYYTRNHVSYMPVTAKDRLFHTERKYLSTAKAGQIKEEYAELVNLLEQVCMKSVM